MSGAFPVVIHHNPGCGTSRNVLALIEAAGYSPEVVEYLSTGWTRGQLLALFAAAGVSPREALREKEARTSHPALLGEGIDDETILAAMIARPVLVQRPFVATPRGVRLCRPSETVLALLDRRPPGAFVKEDGEVFQTAAAPLAEIALRAASPADIPAITAIYAHAVSQGTASYELTPPDEAEMARRFAALADGGYPCLVAEQEGAVIGYAYASPFRPRPAYRFTAENSVYLAPEIQGRGVGPRLMTRLIEDLEKLGFRQVVAVIGDGRRNRASVRLHEAMGFQPAGVIEESGFKFGRWLDTVLMRKALNGGAATPPDPASLPERMINARR